MLYPSYISILDMASSTYGVIVIQDVQGFKVKSALKKFISGGPPHSTVNVLRGELLTELKEKNDHFNYQLHRDPNILLFCTADDVAPLNYEEFLLLESIKKPVDRANTFEKKLDWGQQLTVGSVVNVTLSGPNLAVKTRAQSVILYRGFVGNQPGVCFGVEFLVSLHIKNQE